MEVAVGGLCQRIAGKAGAVPDRSAPIGLGAVLTFAVHSDSENIDGNTVGIILMPLGVVVAALSIEPSGPGSAAWPLPLVAWH